MWSNGHKDVEPENCRSTKGSATIDSIRNFHRHLANVNQ